MTAATPPAPAVKRSNDDPIDALFVWGMLTIFICPIVGFVCGAILAAKNAVTRGVLVMLVSVVSSTLWAVFIVPDIANGLKDDDFETACYTLPEDRTTEQQELVDAAADPSCL